MTRESMVSELLEWAYWGEEAKNNDMTSTLCENELRGQIETLTDCELISDYNQINPESPIDSLEA